MPALWKGLMVTVELVVFSAALAFVLSFIAGFGRLSRIWLIRLITGIYVEVFRGSSLVVQLFWMYFVLPLFGLKLSALLMGVLGLGLNFAAYGAEVVRTSIQAVPRGQTEAAIALNLSRWQRMWRIIVPQAIRMMIPPFGNLLIQLVKSTSIVSLITVADLTFQGMVLRSVTMQTAEIFSLLLVLYFIITYPLVLAMRWLERRVSVGRV
ncbi:MAG: ectoine/hydroxyectoine ABC transporter permease subunit EhuC [Alicyclobacillus macrosporangiidus]|nr:ectoine/hydroxyectoine ABC transporter permease subunit EhuC [Alicyclobacillus macrosporangiidus]MCL6599671.1 ectoine/hydroxyectoine ABC transporter permease subunit EhuC [Alicyclobacillus macrosporangiidus]